MTTETKKPILIYAQDVSESLNTYFTPKSKADFINERNALLSQLENKFDIKTYSFGDEVREGILDTFQDKVTNSSDLFKEIDDLYRNQNLGAVVWASDGIYNEGNNPLYSIEKFPVPIVSIALGDTIPKKDVFIKRANHNKITYLNDKFVVQVDIGANNCAGSSTTLVVTKIQNGTSSVISQTPISINGNNFFTTKEITLDANQAGILHYRLSLSTVKGELTQNNNSKDIFVEVLDARQKILILGASVHPDIGAWKQALSINQNYQITTATLDDFKGNLADYDFVILHQIPAKGSDASSIIKQLNDRKIPRLFIVGTQSDLNKLSEAQSLVKIVGDTKNTNDVQSVFGNNFNLFTWDQNLMKDLPYFAPLTAPFGNFVEQNQAQVLLYQKIGKVDTKYPLVAMGEISGIRTGIICAEGFWKWRMFDFMQHKNHLITEEVALKISQYLSVKEDKRKFRVAVSKSLFNENEQIILDGELYNQSYELINEPDVNLIITNEKKQNFNFTMNKSGRAYHLDAGYFPAGQYTFKATVKVNGETLSSEGVFYIQPIQIELNETTANHSLLKAMSNNTGGIVVAPTKLDDIKKLLLDNNKFKPTLYENKTTHPVINLKWIFGLLLLLLSLEWFLRKYFGGY